MARHHQPIDQDGPILTTPLGGNQGQSCVLQQIPNTGDLPLNNQVPFFPPLWAASHGKQDGLILPGFYGTSLRQRSGHNSNALPTGPLRNRKISIIRSESCINIVWIASALNGVVVMLLHPLIN